MERTSIGTRIKQRRNDLGLTQTQIKQETGISTGNMSEIENGLKLPSTPALISLSNILDCSIDWILKGESLNRETESDQRERRLLYGFRNLSEENKEELMEILEIKLRKSVTASGVKSKLSLSENTSQANIS